MKNGLLISIFLHLIFLFITTFIKFEFKIIPPKFIPLSISYDIVKYESLPYIQPEEAYPEQGYLPPKAKDLPRETIPVIKPDEPLPYIKLPLKDIISPEQKDFPKIETIPGKKDFTPTGEIKLPPKAYLSDDQGFVIEGISKEREIINKPLPKYPENYTGEASITLDFVLLPDGTIKDIIISKKGDPILEQEAVEAFKQWRFKSLPQDQPQITQQGKITFIFKLK